MRWSNLILETITSSLSADELWKEPSRYFPGEDRIFLYGYR
jgi:hypothetical protein